ncbi:proteasome regulatory particle base subunit rpn10 [Linderina macrospora]|uniref:Proteasome regulatory particle base subunit rpn10 n=1 Tax=Linderina macrospora TaxID=4868 RepID=A0ACC1J1Q6_9FUNG|nr:proteasome regulatory particle base subunit rpn10 [Linderina macrospora]
MVLEATVLVIDNSEWSRDGDFTPNRFQAQMDSVHYLFSVKTNDNPENTVGVIANGGDSPDVRVSLTGDLGVLLKGLHGLGIRGESHFDTGIQIAQLILKHRANKHQKQRIIAFSASPIEADERSLVKLGKKLKKNGVSVDVVNFGEHVANEQKLAAFVDAANNNDTSHLVTVPPGPHILSEQIRSSPIVGGGPSGSGAGGSGGGDFEFGIDADADPELALALRMSLQEEEERQRRDAEQRGGAAAEGASGQQAAADEDVTMEELDEDEQLRRAIQMSLQESGESGVQDGGSNENDDLVASLIGSLPGVNPDDPALQSVLNPDAAKKDGNSNSNSNDKTEDHQ